MTAELNFGSFVFSEKFVFGNAKLGQDYRKNRNRRCCLSGKVLFYL
ncbi:hypothetical protein LEP1GSC133_2689 [Leptospira borgpetersenii serovar Pomona str. 200901868]|uniref:Uncharacterized protein n=1 Tax=Leptospira borgpetersenii serovar Pomona str. 200901868 TaxID=1192866 RepID=M6WC16_LEPBO|nr:hypothetical protein LEP1GSC133_2689 [Leptospira borgpetersenii serovar Pomona str. 200901868]